MNHSQLQDGVHVSLQKKSVRGLWTKIYLFIKYHYDNFYNLQCTKVEDLQGYLIFIEKMCSEIIQIINTPIEEYLKSIKLTLYECIFTDDVKCKINFAVEDYIRIVINYYCGDEEYFKYKNLIIEMNEIMKNYPIDIENIFLKSFKSEIMKHCVDCGKKSTDFRKSLLHEFLIIKKDIIDKQVTKCLFPVKSLSSNEEIFLNENFYYNAFFQAQKHYIFDIFMDFPDSQETLTSMRTCIYILGTAMELCEILKSEIKRRLIHPAVSTTNLIWAYLCIVRSIRIVDETSCLEESITPDIRNYLLKRDDAIKAIVDKILCFDSDRSDGIYEELKDGEPLKIIDQEDLHDYGDIMCSYSEINNWEPDLIGVSDNRILWHKKLDVLSLLLSIYTSQELFAIEYKQLLSHKILRKMKCNQDKELRNLETLKMKFGAKYFKDCDVILKDIRDSDEITTNIQSKQKQDSEFNWNIPVKAFIISGQYWAKFQQKTFSLPQEMQKNLDSFEKYYKTHKRNRRLQWHTSVGNVSLKLILDNRIKISMDVKPIQAALIYLFTQQNQWKITQLANTLGISITEARGVVRFWNLKNVLKRVEDKEEIYSTIEENDVDHSELERENRRKEMMDITMNIDEDGNGGGGGNSNNTGVDSGDVCQDDLDDVMMLHGDDENGGGSGMERMSFVESGVSGACGTSAAGSNTRSNVTGGPHLRDAEFQNKLWNTIQSILRFFCNLRQPPSLEKIFMMIPIYTMEDPVKITKEQLASFMTRKVLEKAVVIKDKKYSLAS